MKILNLYACLGGNRYKWDEVTDVEVTAVELDPELSKMYQKRFPNDNVIVGDAHQYLLDHYKEFDFIWASPPCPTHSRFKLNQAKGTGNHKPVFPDMQMHYELRLNEKDAQIVELNNKLEYIDRNIGANTNNPHLKQLLKLDESVINLFVETRLKPWIKMQESKVTNQDLINKQYMLRSI
jgi:DNA (cytosine-5)-methyltransferase 1